VLPEACDDILIRAHTELQRLSEEFLQADRARALLVPLLETLRRSGTPPPYRVVDVGCGLGYVVRALAAHGRLGHDVELIGCDMNRTLLERARALAEEESPACEVRGANAIRLGQPAPGVRPTRALPPLRGPPLVLRRAATSLGVPASRHAAIMVLADWVVDLPPGTHARAAGAPRRCGLGGAGARGHDPGGLSPRPDRLHLRPLRRGPLIRQ